MSTESRKVRAWALYDWANSAFATTVMAGFFPVFFKQYWSQGTPPELSTYWLGVGSSVASLIVLLLSPVLGTLGDAAGRRKQLLGLFTALGILSTAALYAVPGGGWALALVLFALGSVGFGMGITFYDSLLIHVAGPQQADRVSAYGYALGYLGGGILLAVNVAMTLQPAWFGLADAAEAVRWSFLTVALWWLVFSLPLFRQVPEPPALAASTGQALRATFIQLRDTLRAARAQRDIWLFLVAYWLYIDGVHTIIRMAVDFGLALGLPSTSLIKALLLVQFLGFPAAIAFGRLAERIGTRPALYIGLAIYCGVTAWAYVLDSVAEFYLMAAAIALAQGGVQALSRSMFSRMIPPERSGEWFGFFNMVGKFAAIFGPLLVGISAVAFGSNRLAILSLLLLFGIGMLCLARVPEPRAGRPTA